ncbi:hypothetical protein [Vulgatibacter incomptus]|nr:hypothetical protein [Vulgatibacter incomptus]
MSLHQLAEARSLAFHRIVAERILRDPDRLDAVRERLDAWIAEGGRAAVYAREWRRLVDFPPAELAAILIDEGERATELRQSTPFSGFLDPRERWKLWAEVRERYERESSDGAGSDRP